MSRPTLDDLKRQVDGTDKYDPVQARKRWEPEPQPEKVTWCVELEQEATIYTTAHVEARTKEEAREKVQHGEYDPSGVEDRDYHFSPGIVAVYRVED